MLAIRRMSDAINWPYAHRKTAPNGKLTAYLKWAMPKKYLFWCIGKVPVFRDVCNTLIISFLRNHIMKNTNIQKKSKLNLIPIELAQQMVNAYDKQRRNPAAEQRSKELGKKVEEPRSFWVSKEALLE